MANDIITMGENIVTLDVNKFINDMRSVQIAMVDETSIYENAIKYINENFSDNKIKENERLQIITQMLAQMTISLTATAAQSALQMQQLAFNADLQRAQVESQIKLADAEVEFNKARTELVKAQTITEGEKALSVKREIENMDDNLRIKEAEFLTNATFGYASGGVNVPDRLMTEMLNKINRVTPKRVDATE